MRGLLLFLCAALSPASRAVACGPEIESCLSTQERHPDQGLEKLVEGDVGLIQPGWQPRYLVVAWRHLAGLGMTSAHHEALFGEPDPPPPDVDMAIVAWLSARGGERSHLSPWLEDKATWSSTLNCREGAFRNATRTLQGLVEAHGREDELVEDWIRAQDAVFDNCDGDGVLPEPAPEDSPPWLRHERAYQLAAAHMYRGEHEAAHDAFSRIAADPASPRRELAGYLAARALVRQALWRMPPDPAAALRAREALDALREDPAFATQHADAARLAAYLQVRATPNERLEELAASFAGPAEATLAQDLVDFDWLIQEGATARHELVEWVRAWGAAEGGAEALRRFETAPRTPWLVLALLRSSPSPERREALLAAAAEIEPGSPAWPSAASGAARLLVEAGRRDEASSLLARALAGPLPRGTRNALEAQRLPLVSAERDWWELAAREPLGCLDHAADSIGPLIAPDAADVVAHGIPTSRLVDASRRAEIHEGLRRRLALQAWTRAVLLGDDAEAVRAADTAKELTTGSVRSGLETFLAAPDAESRRFRGALVLLWLPGLSPVPNPHVAPRAETAATNARWLGNWWCAIPETSVAAPFVTPDEVQRAHDEASRLAALGSGPVALGEIVLAHAREHPRDPLVPEALHRVVEAVRFGCSGERESEIGRAAFERLHAKHRRSPWAARTPYWY